MLRNLFISKRPNVSRTNVLFLSRPLTLIGTRIRSESWPSVFCFPLGGAEGVSSSVMCAPTHCYQRCMMRWRWVGGAEVPLCLIAVCTDACSQRHVFMKKFHHSRKQCKFPEGNCLMRRQSGQSPLSAQGCQRGHRP